MSSKNFVVSDYPQQQFRSDMTSLSSSSLPLPLPSSESTLSCKSRIQKCISFSKMCKRITRKYEKTQSLSEFYHKLRLDWLQKWKERLLKQQLDVLGILSEDPTVASSSMSKLQQDGLYKLLWIDRAQFASEIEFENAIMLNLAIKERLIYQWLKFRWSSFASLPSYSFSSASTTTSSSSSFPMEPRNMSLTDYFTLVEQVFTELDQLIKFEFETIKAFRDKCYRSMITQCSNAGRVCFVHLGNCPVSR